MTAVCQQGEGLYAESCGIRQEKEWPTPPPPPPQKKNNRKLQKERKKKIKSTSVLAWLSDKNYEMGNTSGSEVYYREVY